MINVGISGANGFLGRHLIDLIQTTANEVKLITFGSAPTRVANMSCEWVLWDLKKGLQAPAPKLDVFIHLAWNGLPNYDSQIHLDQVIGHLDLMTSLCNSGLRRAFVSGTCFEYGDVLGMISEEEPTRPNSRYSQAKVELERRLRDISVEEDFKLLWGRIFYIFGKDNFKSSLVQSILNAHRKGLPLYLENPNRICDYLHVDKVAKQILNLSLNSDFSGILNLGSGVPQTVGNHARELLELLDMELEIVEKHPQEEEAVGFWADVSLLSSQLKG